MNLKIRFKNEYSADGTYTLRAPGCILASLSWANEYGPLADYTAFGIIPLAASNGTGSFLFTGSRMIPEEANAVFVRAVSCDLKTTFEEQFPIPNRISTNAEEPVLFHAVAMSDLHLVRKTGTLLRALRSVSDADCLLLTGDLTNDGTDAEYALFEACLKLEVPELPVFCANGNHDLLSGSEAYFVFEEARKRNASQRGILCYNGCEGTYVANIGHIEIIGLNAVKPWKELSPISKAQIHWLDDHLSASTAQWHIILCHTPLNRSVPVRNGHLASYMSRDEHLQQILDSHRNVLFLSGHTHLSPNLNSGTVYCDQDKPNVYINCGSIRPTELGQEGILAPAEWVDGNTVELILCEHSLTIRMYALHENKWISRGNYCFSFMKEDENNEEN